MRRKVPVHLAITSHGYGHMTRSLAVLGRLIDLFSGVEAHVSTTLPPQRIARELSGRLFRYRRFEYEPGTAQKNCFEVDIEGTRRAYRRFFEEREEHLRAEERFLRDIGARAVVADIPALAVRAAARQGVPAIGVSNFTWDWILEPLFEGSSLAGRELELAEDYAAGELYLRLPLGAEDSPFPRTEPVPLAGRRARLGPEEVRRRLGLPPHPPERVVLVCPGGWGAGEWGSIEVSGCDGFRFVLVGDLPVRTEAPSTHLGHDLPEGLSFPDLVGAADVLLGKPGYGTAAECIIQRTPMLGIERRDFREAAPLVEGLRRAGPFAQISLEDFFHGRWEEPLYELLAVDTPWAGTGGSPLGREFVCREDPARDVAERIGAHLGWTPRPDEPGPEKAGVDAAGRCGGSPPPNSREGAT